MRSEALKKKGMKQYGTAWKHYSLCQPVLNDGLVTRIYFDSASIEERTRLS